MKKQLTYRAYLEIEDDNGERVFCDTNDILKSPKLQAQCIEKAALRRIINRLKPYIEDVGQPLEKFEKVPLKGPIYRGSKMVFDENLRPVRDEGGGTKH